MAASNVQLASLWQVEKSLRGAGDISQRVPVGDDRGELMSIYTVEIPLSLLPPCSHFTKQAFDLLNQLEENGLAQQDVDPGVQNRVEGGKAYRS